MFEALYADIHAYQYAWIGMIMTDLQRKNDSLYVVRSILLYADMLMERNQSRKALCVLRVGQRAVDQLNVTMEREVGDDRFDLSIQDYKVTVYLSKALSALGRRDDSIGVFQEAIFIEQQHRKQAMMEHQDVESCDDHGVIKTLDNNVSVLHVISETLGIPRAHLDAFYEEDDQVKLSAAEELDDAQIWKCIQSPGFGLNVRLQEPMDCCAHCWTARNASEKRLNCSRCKAVPYCNRDCQRADWKYHKEDCVQPVEREDMGKE